MTRFTPQWLQSGSYAASQDRRLIGALWPAPACSGCAVTVASGMTLNIAAGQVAVPSQNNTGTTLCTSDAVEQVVIPAAPPSGQNRVDLVICRPRGTDLDGGANNDWIWDSVQGTAAASATVPATPAGTVAVAQVFVPGAAAAIVAANLTDVRPFGLAVAGAPALPPPVTSGSTVQSYVDQNGEVWVAKNGVNAGAWRKARDVLHGHWYRAAAVTFTATLATLVFDTATRDTYGLYNLTSGVFTCPVAGWYQVSGLVAATFQAVNNALNVGLYQNSGLVAYIGSLQAYGAFGMRFPLGACNVFCAANDQLTIGPQLAAGGTNTPGIVGATNMWANIDYLGAG